ncbi:hypothetical protein [Bifidobacterium eulemuris]|uniref:Uncharacterized protein n=1 Tax=Bifidobacterium eulemuris TaxID=1765219 RepID=A0A261FZJ4_9BIFI|nr:hypothetical protein [Bifidobacterium eulemuris]OZG64612.1 hypothetical protein BEUL_2163 [Bifidobacterium eulemuris]QOL32370.1 hypothetical protein BE0216_07820 [Bifidobacterium eulemuris]
MVVRWLEVVGRTACAVAERLLPCVCALAMMVGVGVTASTASAEENEPAAQTNASTAQQTADWDPANATAFTEYNPADVQGGLTDMRITLNGQDATATSNVATDSGYDYSLGFQKIDVTSEKARKAVVKANFKCSISNLATESNKHNLTLAQNETELMAVAGASTQKAAYYFLASNCFGSESWTVQSPDTFENSPYVWRVDGQRATNSNNLPYYVKNIGLPANEGYVYDGVWLKYKGQLRMRLSWVGTVNNKRYVLAYDDKKDSASQCKPWVETSEANKCMLTEVPEGATVVVSFVNTNKAKVGYKALAFNGTNTGLSQSSYNTNAATAIEGDTLAQGVGDTVNFQVTKRFAGSQLDIFVGDKYSSNSDTCTEDSKWIYSSSTGVVSNNLPTNVSLNAGTLSPSTNVQTFTLTSTGNTTLKQAYPNNFVLCAKETISKNNTTTAADGLTGSDHTVTVSSHSALMAGGEIDNASLTSNGQQVLGLVTATHNWDQNKHQRGEIHVSSSDMLRYASDNTNLNESIGSEARRYNSSTEIRDAVKKVVNRTGARWTNNYYWLTTRDGKYENTELYGLGSGGRGRYGESQYTDLQNKSLSVYNGGTMMIVTHNDISVGGSVPNFGWSQVLTHVTLCATAACDATAERVEIPPYQGVSGGDPTSGTEPSGGKEPNVHYCGSTIELTKGALRGVKVTVCESPGYYRASDSSQHQSLQSMHPYYVVLEGVTADVTVRLNWSKVLNPLLVAGSAVGISEMSLHKAAWRNNQFEHATGSSEWAAMTGWNSSASVEWRAYTNAIQTALPTNGGQFGNGFLIRLKLAPGYTNHAIYYRTSNGVNQKLTMMADYREYLPSTKDWNADNGSETVHSQVWGQHRNECGYASTTDPYLYCYIYDNSSKTGNVTYKIDVTATPVVYKAHFSAGKGVSVGTSDGQVDASSMPSDITLNLASQSQTNLSIEVQSEMPKRSKVNNTQYYFQGWKAYWCTNLACTTPGDEITLLENLLGRLLQPGDVIPLGKFTIPDGAYGVILEAQWDDDNTVQLIDTSLGKAYYYYVDSSGNVSWVEFDESAVSDTAGKSALAAFRETSPKFIQPVPNMYDSGKVATTYSFGAAPATLTGTTVKTDGTGTQSEVTLTLVSELNCAGLLGDSVSDDQKKVYCQSGEVMLADNVTKVLGLGNDIGSRVIANPTDNSDAVAADGTLSVHSQSLRIAVYRVEAQVSYDDNISSLSSASLTDSRGADVDKTSIASTLQAYPEYTGRYLFDNYRLPTVSAEADKTSLDASATLQWVVKDTSSRTVSFLGWGDSATTAEGSEVTPNSTVRRASTYTAANGSDPASSATWFGVWKASMPPVSQLPLTGTKPWWMQVIVPAVSVALLGLAAWLRWRKGSQLWSNHA